VDIANGGKSVQRGSWAAVAVAVIAALLVISSILYWHFKLDWDLLAIGTLVMAAATFGMAVATYHSNRLFARARERPQIVELLKFAILPLISKLEGELGALENGRYHNWDHKSGEAELMLTLEENWEGEEVMGDLRRRFPKVKELMDEHDRLLKVLNERLKTLTEVIYTDEFKKKCKDEIQTYHANPKNPRIRYRDAIEDAPKHFPAYVIDNFEELPEENPYYNFWKKHGHKFLEIRRTDKKFKEEMASVDNSAKNLKGISEPLKEELIGRKNELRKKYWITKKDILEVQARDTPIVGPNVMQPNVGAF